jgi:hypothetical protein
MQLSSYTVSKGVKMGLLGGLVGGVVLGVAAFAGSAATGQEVPYVTIAKKLQFGDYAVIGGWILHFIVSLVAGGVFVGVTGLVKRFTLTTIRKSLWVGALAGVVVWVIFDVPVIGLLVPADLTDPTLGVGSFVLHIVYGIVTALVGVSQLRRGVTTVAKR